METMLTRKLAKRGLIGNGTLFLIALASIAASHEIGTLSLRAETDTAQLRFDTVLLKLHGATAEDLTEAPCINLNRNAALYVDNYIDENTELLESIRSKSEKYFRIADAIFDRYGLPQELKYLAVVESELKMSARSKVGALGPWQLMPETARLLSLKVSRRYDERTQYYKSTIAAARYLKDLHSIFGDWLLVIAAYNSGPGKVFEAIKRSGSRNFWRLQNFLPAETRGHVKKFVATHYYFEGKGSVATMTRAEALAYRLQMMEFVAKHNSQFGDTQASAEVAVNNAAPAKTEVPRFANVVE
jgi:membrane-bound lytic murein transglycosylase D